MGLQYREDLLYWEGYLKVFHGEYIPKVRRQYKVILWRVDLLKGFPWREDFLKDFHAENSQYRLKGQWKMLKKSMNKCRIKYTKTLASEIPWDIIDFCLWWSISNFLTKKHVYKNYDICLWMSYFFFFFCRNFKVPISTL